MEIDPSGSYGSGSRKWYAVVWSVSSSNGGSLSDEIESMLNTNHSADTKSVIIVPKDLLTADTSYAISLTLINFLNGTSTTTFTVNVLTAGTPSIRILGSKIVEVFRWQTLSLRAEATLPACIKSYKSLKYQWRAYVGFTFDSSLVSSSIDTRAFTLGPYSLEAKTTYTIFASVVYVDNSGKVLSSSSSLSVVVGDSGVQPVISGGSERTTDAATVVIMDASKSYSRDYPVDSNLLVYRWQCMVVAGTVDNKPGYGADCPGMLSSGSTSLLVPTFRIPPGILVAANAYQFRVFVTVNGSLSVEEASTTIYVSARQTPDVSLVSVGGGVYANSDKVSLSGVVSGSLPVLIMLQCDRVPDTDLETMTLTPLTYTSSSNLTYIAFAFGQYSFVPGIGEIF